jgi:hypothetical protein
MTYAATVGALRRRQSMYARIGKPRSCWACGAGLNQSKEGRPRITCGDVECLAERRKHNKVAAGIRRGPCCCQWCNVPGVA